MSTGPNQSIELTRVARLPLAAWLQRCATVFCHRSWRIKGQCRSFRDVGFPAGQVSMPRLLRHVVLSVLAIAPHSLFASETGLSYTQFGQFELGSGSLSEIRSRLGAAVIRKSGDAGEHMERLCYSVKQGSVTFLAAEVGGPDALTGIELSRAAGPDCVPWPASSPQPSLTISGIYLGMTMTEFQQLLPATRSIENGRLIVSFESKKPYTQKEMQSRAAGAKQSRNEAPQDYWDVVVSIIGRFDQGLLSEVRVWRTETN